MMRMVWTYLKYLYTQVWLSRTDGHMGLANSVALKLSGISNLTKDPEGGTIVRTVDGGDIEFHSFVLGFI
jgi:hypothetical protein